MLFDNPIFEGWYTDLVDVYRVVTVKDGSISRQERKKVGEGIPCRVYHTGTVRLVAPLVSVVQT
mgnify:CR=1 FL=1